MGTEGAAQLAPGGEITQQQDWGSLWVRWGIGSRSPTGSGEGGRLRKGLDPVSAHAQLHKSRRHKTEGPLHMRPDELWRGARGAWGEGSHPFVRPPLGSVWPGVQVKGQDSDQPGWWVPLSHPAGELAGAGLWEGHSRCSVWMVPEGTAWGCPSGRPEPQVGGWGHVRASPIGQGSPSPDRALTSLLRKQYRMATTRPCKTGGGGQGRAPTGARRTALSTRT